MRHSCASYHVAYFGDMVKPALMLEQHYLQAVKRSGALRFWNINPQSLGGIDQEGEGAKSGTQTSVGATEGLRGEQEMALSANVIVANFLSPSEEGGEYAGRDLNPRPTECKLFPCLFCQVVSGLVRREGEQLKTLIRKGQTLTLSPK